MRAITGAAPAATISAYAPAIYAIQFVDSSPEALRKRLGHGNIYPAERGAGRAAVGVPARPAAALREVGLGLSGAVRAAAGGGAAAGPA